MAQPPIKDLSRKMKFPYTYTAKIALFPWAYHINQNSSLFKFYFIGVAATLPLFVWISSKANSPANVAAWAKKRADEEKNEHH